MPLTDADRTEIFNLYGRAAAAIDEGDAGGWAACFTSDGRFTLGAEIDLKGREQLAQFAHEHHEGPRAATRHHVTTLAVHDAADGAAGRSYALMVLGTEVLGSVIYDDDLARTDAGWRFRRRTLAVK